MCRCHRYHYHLAPLCLLESLGQDFSAVNRTFWKASDPMEMVRGWPSYSDPSPVVGWAMDGYPIMGPYDDTGQLQVGASAGQEYSTLDECNGKFSPRTGKYAYYLTPNPPYAVGCFRGPLGIGTYEDRAIYGNAICPAQGIKSLYCDGELEGGSSQCLNSIAIALETTEEKCALACQGPYFLFQTCPLLSGQRWQTYSLTFAILYLLLCAIPAVGVLIYLRHFKMPKRQRLPLLDFRTFIYSFVAIGSISAALSLFLDPLYSKQSVEACILGILYGLRYPCINCCLALLILSLHELVDARVHLRRYKTFLPKTKIIFFVITVAEFATQLFADVMRGMGYPWPWLAFCQYFFLGEFFFPLLG